MGDDLEVSDSELTGVPDRKKEKRLDMIKISPGSKTERDRASGLAK